MRSSYLSSTIQDTSRQVGLLEYIVIMSGFASAPLVGRPGQGAPLSPQEQLKAKIARLRDTEKILKTDVLVVGSGPIGAVFARKLVVEGQKKVLMIEMGEQYVSYLPT